MLQPHKKNLNDSSCLNEMPSKPGFFLLACIITLSILMTSIYIVSSYATAWYTLQTHAELEKMCALFLYAQQNARSTGQQTEITFDQTYQYYRCAQFLETFPKHLTFGTLPECKGPPSAPEKPIIDYITFEKKKSICYPDGTIQSGTLYMLDTKTQTAYALTIPVGHTHYPKLYKFVQHQWVAVS